MGYSVFPAPSAASKTRYVVTLLSGTSWTVPAGCLYVNAKLFGGGGGAAGSRMVNTIPASDGQPGQVISTSVITTPGASITYAIGAGGSGGAVGVTNNNGSNGGTTTFTGATSAAGGSGGRGDSSGTQPAGPVGTQGAEQFNAGLTNPASQDNPGGAGGAGKIELEYWL